MNIIKLKKALNSDIGYSHYRKEMDPLKHRPRTWDHQGAPPRESAVLILLYDDGGEWKFPLIQRPTYNGAHSGQISFPGGKYEKEDESLIHTAKREAHEEIGVKPEVVNVLGELTDLYVPPSNFNIRPVVAMACETPNITMDEREVEQVYHISVEDLLNKELRKQKDVKVGDNVRFNVPCFEFGQAIVWGATAIILEELAGILEEIKHG